VEWTKGDRFVAEAYDGYWGGRPNASQLILRPKPEAAARIASLTTGEVNFIDRVPTDQMEQINASANLKTEVSKTTSLNVIVINSTVSPLDKKEVRQALSLSIDRQSLIRDLLKGQAGLMNGSILPSDFAYDPNRPPFEYNPEKAKSLLAQAGYKGEEIVSETRALDLPLNEALVAMWKSVGLNVNLVTLDPAVRLQKMQSKSLGGLLFLAPGSLYGDPDGVIFRLLGPGGQYEYWKDAEFARLGEEARFSTAPALRKRNYDRMQDMLLENMPWLVLYQEYALFATSKDVDWKPTPNQRVDFRKENLSFTG
jgi:peptide/nickel transport system substrate-binding protein